MTTQLQDLFDFYMFTPGRRIFALDKIADMAREEGQATLIQRAEEGIQHDQTTLNLYRRWEVVKKRAKKSTHPPPSLPQQRPTRIIDGELDTSLGSWFQNLQSLLKAPKIPADMRESAQILTAQFFPSGAKPLTELPFIDEIAAVKNIVTLANEGVIGEGASAQKLSVHVENLKHGHFVDAIDALSTELHDVIKADHANPELIYKDVEIADRQGQELMLEVVVYILTNTRSDNARRAMFLKPILDQNQAISDLLAKQRPVRDVNPKTGEATGDDETPEPED